MSISIMNLILYSSSFGFGGTFIENHKPHSVLLEEKMQFISPERLFDFEAVWKFA